MFLELSERLKVSAGSNLDNKKKLGQYFTPAPICEFMASMLTMGKNVKLLDPGCGVGALTSAVLDRAIRENVSSIEVDLYDFDKDLIPYIDCVVDKYNSASKVQANLYIEDFILSKSPLVNEKKIAGGCEEYTHVISNPPYKKLSPASQQGIELIKSGLDYYNLYSAFVSLSISLLKPKGEMVFIVPRSFCNGSFYKNFRRRLIEFGAIKRIHIFGSRKDAFSVDRVLQENVIIHFVKEGKQEDVVISSSALGDFKRINGNEFEATDFKSRIVDFSSIVNPNDDDAYIHIAIDENDQACIERVESLDTSLVDLGVQVSTGPVVDFRVKEFLSHDGDAKSVPLLFPTHLNGSVNWPIKSKKPNFIKVCKNTEKITWENSGTYLLIRRFSSKEEKRRITATYYDSSLSYSKVGFDNKINVIHKNRKGFNDGLAKGLYVYINSTIVDRYFRCFSGHTQINASDLRKIRYPSLSQLLEMGEISGLPLDQESIDIIICKVMGWPKV